MMRVKAELLLEDADLVSEPRHERRRQPQRAADALAALVLYVHGALGATPE
jgi:hypothetical protein